MVTLYIPAARKLQDVLSRLGSEAVQAENIKSRATRNGVTTSLTRMLSLLRTVTQVPANGLACFVGSGHEQMFEPPEPVDTYLYRCGSGFILDPLVAMCETKEVYGLIVMDRQEATIGLLRGTAITELQNIQSNLMGKHDAGGQSQRRFERTMENETVQYYRKVSDSVGIHLLPRMDALQGILIGGPGSTKDGLLTDGGMDYRLLQKVVRPLFSTGYTDAPGLRELATNAAKTLTTLSLSRETTSVEEFVNSAKCGGSKVVYGFVAVLSALREGRLRRVLISERSERAEEFVGLAERSGTEVVLVGTDTNEGKMFLNGFGGIGGFLRW